MRKIIFVSMSVSLILVCIENAISSESVKLMTVKTEYEFLLLTANHLLLIRQL